jgi:hypothetical protein
MLNIVLRAFLWIFERIVSLHNYVEPGAIAAVGIVGMISLGKIAKYTIYRFRVGVRADFQDFVKVNEFRAFHHMPLSWFGFLDGVRREQLAPIAITGQAHGAPAAAIFRALKLSEGGKWA